MKKKFKLFEIEILNHANKELFVRKNFKKPVNLMSSSGDNTIRVWNLEKDNLVKEYKCDDWGFWCLIQIPSGEIICSDRLNIKIWNLNYDTSRIIGHHSDWIKCLAFLPNDNLLFSGSSDQTIKIWDLKGVCLKTLYGHTSTINCLALLTNRRLLSGSFDKKIKLYDIDSGLCLKTFDFHFDGISCLLSLSPDFALSSSYDKSIKLWNFNDTNFIKIFRGHTKRILSILLLPNNELVSNSDDHCLKFWDIMKGICIRTIKMPYTSCLYLLSNGKLAIGFLDGKIQIRNLNNLKQEKMFKAHHAVVTSFVCLNQQLNKKL
jgi:WD40 repeat protein